MPNSRLLIGAALAMALAACSDSSTMPTQARPDTNVAMAVNHNAQNGAAVGFTAGWLAGETVEFRYHKNFFCALPVEDGLAVGSTTECEAGSDGTVDPRPGNIPVLYVMTPMGFRPDASTLHCPIVGQCINHPSTIDLSRLLGASAANAPLPAHSHIIEVRSGGWWELHVIGVKDLATWNVIVAGKSLPTVRALQAADPGGVHITPDILTNTYLSFDVRPH